MVLRVELITAPASNLEDVRAIIDRFVRVPSRPAGSRASIRPESFWRPAGRSDPAPENG
jgi:hypothetical protein